MKAATGEEYSQEEEEKQASKPSKVPAKHKSIINSLVTYFKEHPAEIRSILGGAGMGLMAGGPAGALAGGVAGAVAGRQSKKPDNSLNHMLANPPTGPTGPQSGSSAPFTPLEATQENESTGPTGPQGGNNNAYTPAETPLPGPEMSPTSSTRPAAQPSAWSAQDRAAFRARHDERMRQLNAPSYIGGEQSSAAQSPVPPPMPPSPDTLSVAPRSLGDTTRAAAIQAYQDRLKNPRRPGALQQPGYWSVQ